MASRVVALAAMLFALLPATATALPGLLTQIGHGPPFAVRPAQIIYTGDGSGILGGFSGTGSYPRFGRLRWSAWNQHQAVGSGAVWLDNCEPSCAGGTFKPYAVKVHAFEPRAGHFTRLTLRFIYEEKEVIDRRGIRKFGSSYGYYIIGTTSGERRDRGGFRDQQSIALRSDELASAQRAGRRRVVRC